MAINTDISAVVDRQTGSQFGGNLIRALGMLQQGKQFDKQQKAHQEQQQFENDLREQQFEATRLDRDRTYRLLQSNIANEQADKDALEAITTRAAGDLDKLDEELATFSPKSIFGIRAHQGLQGQLKTHLQEKKINSTKNYFEDMARKNLDPEDYATYSNMENNPDTGLPMQDKVLFLNERVRAKANVQNFKNLPLPAQIYERYKRYVDEGDDMGAEIMLREIQNLKSKDFNHSDNAIFQDALIRRRNADRLLADPKVKDDPETYRRVLVQRRNADADVQKLMAHRSQDQTAVPAPGVAPAVPAAAPSATSTNRVIDFNQSGQLDFK